jgi:hypothetical protein
VAAYGAGASGAPLELRDVRISATRPLANGDRGYGIAIHPSAILKPPDLRNVWAAHARPSNVKIEAAIVQGGSGAGILIEGSEAEIDGTFVTAVGPQRDGLGRGVVVRSRLLGEIPASATIRHSVISDAYDVGLRVDNARATVEDTTIRNTGRERASENGETACLGNGIRARHNLVQAADAAPTLTVRRSVIDGALEAGVHVEGTSAFIEDSIIRRVSRDACGRFGDAVAAYGYEFSPAEVVLRSSLVEAGPRSGIAVFDAALSLDATVVDGCGETSAVVAPNSALGPSTAASVCRCGSTWAACQAAPSEIAPSLRAFGVCDPAELACTQSRATDLVFVAAGGLPNATFWAHERDDLASVVTDSSGMAVFPSLPDGHTGRFAAALTGYTPVLVHPADLPAGFHVGSNGALVVEYGAGFHPDLLQRELPDFRNGMFVAVEVCQPLAAPPSEPIEVCRGRGVEGLSAELIGASAPFNRPCYPPEQASICDVNRDTTSKYGLAYFYNIPAGDYVLALHGPRDESGVEGAMDCTPTQQGWGLLADAPNHYRVRVEPGWNNVPARVFCELR